MHAVGYTVLTMNGKVVVVVVFTVVVTILFVPDETLASTDKVQRICRCLALQLSFATSSTQCRATVPSRVDVWLSRRSCLDLLKAN